MVGFSYAVPDSIEEDQDQTYGGFPSSIPGVNVNEFVINLNNRDETYLFGPFYAMELRKSLAVGATLYVHYRARETMLNQVVALSNGQDEWTNQYCQTDETGLRPVLGIMWNPADKVSLGLTVSNTYILSSTTEVQATLKPATSGDVVRSVLKTNDECDVPTTIALGAAWFPSDSLLYAFDVTWSSSTSDSFQSRDATFNFAAGVEYYPTSQWAVRAGAFTNLAATPRSIRPRSASRSTSTCTASPPACRVSAPAPRSPSVSPTAGATARPSCLPARPRSCRSTAAH